MIKLFCWHNWGRWSEVKKMYKTEWQEDEIDEELNEYVSEIFVQSRYCLKCNKIQERIIR